MSPVLLNASPPPFGPFLGNPGTASPSWLDVLGEPSRTSMGSDAGQGTRQERWAARETNRRRTAYQRALEQWQSDDNELTQMIKAARSFNGSTDVNGSTVVLRKNERVFFFLPAV